MYRRGNRKKRFWAFKYLDGKCLTDTETKIAHGKQLNRALRGLIWNKTKVKQTIEEFSIVQ